MELVKIAFKPPMDNELESPRYEENGATVEKSKKSILFDADPIFGAVTAHVQILKNKFLLK